MGAEFDKEFKKAKRLVYFIGFIYLLIIGFAIWVVVKLLHHFGLI